MRKLHLEFTGQDLPNGLLAAKAEDLYFAVSDFSDWLRKKYKYEDIESMDLYDVRGKLYEFLADYDCSLDMLD